MRMLLEVPGSEELCRAPSGATGLSAEQVRAESLRVLQALEAIQSGVIQESRKAGGVQGKAGC